MNLPEATILIVLFARTVESCGPQYSPDRCITGASGDHSSCLVASRNLIEVIAVVKEAALTAHNEARSSLTLNPTPDPALDGVVWNDNLAITAEHYASSCNWGHDKSNQRIIPNVGWGSCIGQNLWATSDNSATVALAVSSWFAEKDNYNYTLGTSNNGGMVGHYTQLVWRDTAYIGCGIAHCSSLTGSAVLKTIVVCNYGACGNYNNQKPY